MIHDEASKHYRLGPRVIELTGSVPGWLDSVAKAKSHMATLWQEALETVRFIRRSGTVIVAVDVLECSQAVWIAGNIGRRMPIYCTGAGRLFLAFGDEALRCDVMKGSIDA